MKTLKTRDVFLKASDSLLGLRPKILDFKIEADAYVTRMLPKLSPRDRRFVVEGGRTLQLTPNTRTLRAIVCHAAEPIPISTLTDFKKQPGSCRQVVFINAGPEMTPACFKQRRERILRVHNDSRLNFLFFHFSEQAPIGRIRSLLFDVLILSCRDGHTKDPVVISHDADCLGIAAAYAKKVRRIFDAEPLLDLIKGDLYWGDAHRKVLAEGRLPEMPELVLGGEYWRRQNQRHVEADLPLTFPGSNMSIRLASYCAIGGFNRKLRWSEDQELGARIQLIRATLHNRVPAQTSFTRFIPELFTVNNPRRPLKSILENGPFFPRPSTFARERGVDLNLAKLEGAYAARTDLLQMQDLREAIRGDRRALSFVNRRVRRIWRQNSRNDRTLRDRRKVARQRLLMGLPEATDRDLTAQEVARLFLVQ